MPFVVLVNLIIFLERPFKLKKRTNIQVLKREARIGFKEFFSAVCPYCFLGMFDLVTMTLPTRGTPQKQTLSKSTTISNMLSEPACTIHLDFILNKTIRICLES